MFTQARLVLRPAGVQLAAPDPVFLQLTGQFVEALLDGLEVARQFLQPLGRGFTHKARIDQIAQLQLDVVEGHSLGQVDFALEAFLQGVPELENLQGQLGQALGVLGPGATFLFGQGCQRRTITRQRLDTVEDAAVQAGQQDVFHQGIDAAHVAIQQAQLGQPRQLATEELGRLGQLLQEQTLQRATVLEVGLGGSRKALFLDHPSLFHQRREHGHAQAGNLVLGACSHLGKRLGLHRLLGLFLRDRQRGLTGLGKACGQLGQIAAFAKEFARGIHHFQVHPQVTVELLRGLNPSLVRHPYAGHALQLTTESGRQRTFGKVDARQGSLDKVRHRHEVLAQCFGQLAHQGDALGLQHPRHQPFQALGRQLRQQRCWHPQGHAIARMVGLEVIRQWQLQLAELQFVRVMGGGDFVGLAGQHVFLAHDQQLRVLRAFDLVPAVEGGGLVDLRRDARVVEGEQGFLVSQDVTAARLGFQFVELLQQLAVGFQAARTGLDLATHQAFADKQLARQYRLNRPVMHGAATDHDQAVEGDLLVSHHLAALFLPVRLEVVLLDQVAGQRLDPVRLDLRHLARIELGGFHQFGGHQPLRALLAQAG